MNGDIGDDPGAPQPLPPEPPSAGFMDYSLFIVWLLAGAQILSAIAALYMVAYFLGLVTY